eukprot:1048723-Pelagomonas_calceolata.AAC.2
MGASHANTGGTCTLSHVRNLTSQRFPAATLYTGHTQLIKILFHSLDLGAAASKMGFSFMAIPIEPFSFNLRIKKACA